MHASCLGAMENSTGAQGREVHTRSELACRSRSWFLSRHMLHADGPDRKGYRLRSSFSSRPQVAMSNTCTVTCSIKQPGADDCPDGTLASVNRFVEFYHAHGSVTRVWAQEIVAFRPGFRDRNRSRIPSPKTVSFFFLAP